MQVGCLAIVGLFLGALFGAAIGVGVGLACVKVFNVSARATAACWCSSPSCR